MAAAAHLHQICVGAQIPRAHFRVGLKPAGADNYGSGAQLVFFPAIRHADPFDMPVIAQKFTHPRVKINFDSHAAGDSAPLIELTDTPTDSAGGMNHDTGFEVTFAADLDRAGRLPLDSEFAHPVDRSVRLVYQHFG